MKWTATLQFEFYDDDEAGAKETAERAAYRVLNMVEVDGGSLCCLEKLDEPQTREEDS